MHADTHTKTPTQIQPTHSQRKNDLIPHLLPALWSSWAESEVTWDGEVPPLLIHSHKAFYCDGTLNPITNIWQDCNSDIKGNLTGIWWMPLQSINSWLQWKLQRGRPLPSVHGVCGHSESHLCGAGTLAQELGFLKSPGSQTGGWRLNGRCSCCRHTCLHCGEPRTGAPARPCQNTPTLCWLSQGHERNDSIVARTR